MRQWRRLPTPPWADRRWAVGGCRRPREAVSMQWRNKSLEKRQLPARPASSTMFPVTGEESRSLGSTGQAPVRLPPAAAPPARAVCAGWLRLSELLQATVQFPLALLASPGPALGAEPFQVFFEVLVVHGAIALGLAEALGKERLVLPRCHSSNGLRLTKSWPLPDQTEPGPHPLQEPHTRRSQQSQVNFHIPATFLLSKGLPALPPHLLADINTQVC